MLHEDAPTNSVGTGEETSLPPFSEPGRKLRKKKLDRVKSMLDIKLESREQQWPFLVEVPGIGNFIMSGTSPIQVKFNLRKIIQPTITDTKIKITRLNQGEAIKYHMNRTNKSMKGIYEETMNIQEQMPMQQQAQQGQPAAAGSAEKRANAQNAQKAKQLQQQKAQVQKQQASKDMNAQKTAMQNTMKAKMDDMKKKQAAQQAAAKKTGGTTPVA